MVSSIENRASPGSAGRPSRLASTRLAMQYLTALHGLLLSIVDAGELERLKNDAEQELQDPGRWGVTFTLFQCWGRRRA
jgi:hypothetical protein